MQNLNYIETFVLVAETGSFTRGAKARGITKAAASKHITQLENKMGLSLMTRSTREVVLTDEGRFVYEECLKVMGNLAEIESMVSGMKAEPSGVLSVISGPAFAQKYILPFISEFIRKYPKIDLKINFRYFMPKMLEEKVDIVVGVFGSPPPDAIQRTMLKTRRILCAAPAYLIRNGTPIRLKDLHEHSLMIHPHHPDETEIQLQMGTNIKLIPRIISNDQLMLRQCALDELGIAYLQRHVVADDLRKGILVEVLEDEFERENSIPINLYYWQRRHLPSKIRCFVDYLIEKCRESDS